MKLSHLLVLAIIAPALAASACGNKGFGNGDDAGSDSPFVSDVAFGDGNQSDGAKKNGCDATCVQAGGTCSAGVCSLVDNAGNVPTSTQQQLQTGGNADPLFKWLYPYDKTVCARGLLPPTLQFDGTSASNAYVHITCSTLDYKGYFGPSGPVRIALSQTMWNAVMGAVSSSKEAVKVEVTKIFSGNVTGPITETLERRAGQPARHDLLRDVRLADRRRARLGRHHEDPARRGDAARDQDRAAATSATPRAPTARRSSRTRASPAAARATT